MTQFTSRSNEAHGSHGVVPGSPGPSAVHSDLPFIVRTVRTEDQLRAVCVLRAEAYGRHVPEFGASLREPEPVDREPGVISFVAEDKATGLAVGTMRVHLNSHCPLPLEGAVALPDDLRGHLLVEVCRLAIRQGYNKTMVRLALFKALYLYAYAHQAQFMVVAAKSPLNDIYRSLGFQPLIGPGENWVELPYAHNLRHELLKFDVLLAERTWSEMGHPLYHFMGRMFHPDIKVFSAVTPAWHTPRQSDARRAVPA